MRRLGLAALAVFLCAATSAARAADVRIECYDDGNECESTQGFAQKFMQANPDIHITVDKVPYKAILESLPVQLAAGNGPDIARVTDFGTLAPYMLNLRQYLPDAGHWEKEFGPELAWMRFQPNDEGIYGLPTQLTVTAPIVNKTLFDQAKVPMPGARATWEDWAQAVQKVAKATNTPYGMAWDRSGHRYAGYAISMGAKYFATDGAPDVVDAGFKDASRQFIQWAKDGTLDKEVWAATGSGYRDAFAEFQNARIVLYLSGSWQLRRLEKQVGDAFDWVIVHNPCGPAACTGMPGGAAFVGFKATKSPQAVAKFLDYMAQQPVYAAWMADTANVPALASLQHGGVEYHLTPAGNAAMKEFLANAADVSPVANHLQGYRYNRVIFDATADRLSQAMTGQLSLDEAYKRIASDIQAGLAAAQAKK